MWSFHKKDKAAIVAGGIVLTMLSQGCSAIKVTVDPIQIKPIEITVDVNINVEYVDFDKGDVPKRDLNLSLKDVESPAAKKLHELKKDVVGFNKSLEKKDNAKSLSFNHKIQHDFREIAQLAFKTRHDTGADKRLARQVVKECNQHIKALKQVERILA